MKQTTFDTLTGFEKHRRVTRRAQFLTEMNQVVPWSRLLALIEPHYPKAGNGRPPKGLEINAYLAARGMTVNGSTIVDATIIAAPCSSKNEDKKRDPEMHQTKKGNQWYFGMKGHIGVDSQSGMIHSAAVTPANTHDSQVVEHLLHGKETKVWGDSAYSGQRDRIKAKAPRAKDYANEKSRRNAPLTDEQKAKNKTKSKVRAIVEHPFLTIKQIFDFNKVCYRGLQKNAHRFFVACGLANLHRARHYLMRADRRGTSVAA
jgi:transposase, IS5 family